MRRLARRSFSIMVVALTFTCVSGFAYAQPSAPVQTESASSVKAQRKAARKEARARKNAELKKLKDAGYDPAATNSADYPQNLQTAKNRVAATSAAASQ
ncbi:DUF4148 domain-containing protein [Paraburkholderia phytofirmans]|uniref:DUF4148 domain-containing protein n=1 Tax=Paraburkholderia phytofirmans TaxID=261302 RepID=A0ABW9BBP6_9BURK